MILSYGLGLESTAILVRWILDPSVRPCALEDLCVITAVVGSEYPDTIRLVEEHVLPLLRAHGIRYVQVARTGEYEGDGITVLSDTRAPTELHVRGPRRLEDELLENGTVPTFSASTRRCSSKWKAFPLTSFIDGEIQGADYIHVLGFNCLETKRIEKDHSFGGNGRNVSHPLLDWGWDRERCTEFLRDAFGVEWPKSACTFCPFSGGKPEAIQRYRTMPDAAAAALFLELVSRALNPRMTIFKDKSFLSCIRADGNQTALDAFERRLAETPWALYHVRRLFNAAKPGSSRRTAQRSIVATFQGTRPDTLLRLQQLAREQNREILPAADSYTWRIDIRRRTEGTSATEEEFFVLAPAVVRDKQVPSFEANWETRIQTIDLFACP